MPVPAKFGSNVTVEPLEAPAKFGSDVQIEGDSAPPQKGLTFLKTNKAGFPVYHGTPETPSRNVMDLTGVKEGFQRNAAPILGTLGAIGGGAVAGPPGALLGATYGGYAGTGIERDTAGKRRSSVAEALGGAEQGASELTGMGAAKLAGKIAGPLAEKLAPKAVQRLTSAAAEKGSAGVPHEAIKATIGDIEKELLKLPKEQRTVGGFLDAVTRARSAIHEEYGNALGPYANQQVATHSIADSIRDLHKPWMDVSGEGKAELEAIEKAAVQFEKPRTVGQLDSLRQQLNSDLAAFYAKGGNARYAAENGNINLAIDAAIARGARDALYPIADKVSGKPAGYFSDALSREGHLIQLRGILEKRVQDLGGAQAVSEVAPILSSENVSLSAHPGSLPRAGFYGMRNLVAPPRELKSAGKHVAKAITIDPSIDTLPYEVLFANVPRAGQVAEREKKKRLANILTPVPMQ